MDNIIDLKRFPIDQPDSRDGIKLIDWCRHELENHGMLNLAGFMLPQALEKAVSEVRPVLDSSAFLHEREHNIYFEDSICELDASHPALKRMLTSNYTVCADQIIGSVLVKLYEWPAFAEFLAAVMGRRKLFTMDDPLARLNVMAYKQGQALNWHFDRSEFTTTLLLQSPASGGDFQYRTGLRTEQDPNYAGVARLLVNQDEKVKSIKLKAGTLNVFKGRNTAHRVTPVIGERSRIVTVFSYYQTPGVKFSHEERTGFYGRAA